MKTVAVELLHKTFIYDPALGTLTRRKDNKIIGGVGDSGYIIINWNKQIWRVHRIMWAMFYGHWPEIDIDHIDRNKTNNCINNLRLVSRSANVFNAAPRSDNLSGQRGVCFDATRDKWMARRGTVFIGRYDTKEKATEAYHREVELHHNVVESKDQLNG